MLKEGQPFHPRYLRQWPSSCLTNCHAFVPLIALTQCLGKPGPAMQVQLCGLLFKGPVVTWECPLGQP